MSIIVVKASGKCNLPRLLLVKAAIAMLQSCHRLSAMLIASVPARYHFSQATTINSATAKKQCDAPNGVIPSQS